MNDDKTVYILGSGASLLDLTAEEKAHLATQTTIAMNRYLLFWETIGLWPTHFFLADVHWPAIRVAQESLQIIARGPRPVQGLLNERYRDWFGQRGAAAAARAGSIAAHALGKRFLYKPWTPLPATTWFRIAGEWNMRGQWAGSLTEDLFFFRGSLSVLLNLLAIVRPGRKIRLLGVDLSSAASFYDRALAGRPDLQDSYYRQQAASGVNAHATARPEGGVPGIQARWPFIAGKVAEAGLDLACCTRQSLLVTEGLCPYVPVIEPPAQGPGA